jgi:hypothetical protein
MGFVHAMLLDIADSRDSGSTWDRERRLTDSLVETTTRFDDLYEPPPSDPGDSPPPPEPPRGGFGTVIREALGVFNRALPAR